MEMFGIIMLGVIVAITGAISAIAIVGDTLDKTDGRIYGIIFAIFIISLIISTAYMTTDVIETNNSRKEVETVEQIDIISIEEQISLEDSVKCYMEFLNLKHIDVVFKQARLESAYFTSKIFRENNNCFGMKQAYKRPNLQTGVRNGHATYDSWQDCIVDYALYQVWSGKGLNRDEYIKMLGRSYAEDPNYINLISK